jgi:hypothetical protein
VDQAPSRTASIDPTAASTAVPATESAADVAADVAADNGPSADERRESILDLADELFASTAAAAATSTSITPAAAAAVTAPDPDCDTLGPKQQQQQQQQPALSLNAQKREARRQRILAKGAERLAMVNGDRIPSGGGHGKGLAPDDALIEPSPLPPPPAFRGTSSSSKAGSKHKVTRPPGSPKGNAAISSKPFNRELLTQREERQSARKDKAAAVASKSSSSGKRWVGTSDFWVTVQSIVVPLLIVAFGVGVGLLLLPAALDATAALSSSSSGDSPVDPRSVLQQFLSKSTAAAPKAAAETISEFHDTAPDSDGFDSSITSSGEQLLPLLHIAGQYSDSPPANPVLAALLQLLSVLASVAHAVPLLHWSCVPLALLALTVRLGAAAGFAALRLATGNRAFAPVKAAVSDGFDPVAMAMNAVPALGQALRTAASLKGVIADVALMHCAVLVTVAAGVLPIAAVRLGLPLNALWGGEGAGGGGSSGDPGNAEL